MDKEKIYFPGLNGIRAMAVLLVFISHSIRPYNFSIVKGHIISQQAGELGVTVFFALSGFLITYLLLVEKRNTGEIHLKNFYFRRILRIWPLYFFYILLAIGFTFRYFHKLDNYQYLYFYIIFFANVPFHLDKYLPALVHLWSVGVEEQFYAFWPLFLKFKKNIKRNILYIIMAMILIRIVLAWYSVHSGNRLPYKFTTSMRYDCMAIGAMFAVLYYDKNKLLQNICKSFVVPLLFYSLIILSVFYTFHLFSIFSDDVASIITGLFIINQIQGTKKTTFLENPIMSSLGQISYGLYVYHMLILIAVPIMLTRIGMELPVFGTILIELVLTIAVAYASYHLFEKRFLKLKQKYANIISGKI